MSHEKPEVYIPLSDGRLCPVEVVTLYRLPGDLPEAEVEWLAGCEADEPPLLERVVYGPGASVATRWERVEVEGKQFWEVVVAEFEG